MNTLRRKWRIGVLGCGRVSARYREVLGQELADRVEVVVAADLDIAKATAFAEVVGGTPVSSIEELVAAAPDLVCVLTESGNHAVHALQLIDAGLNIVVEKPVALRPADAERMRDAAAAKGVMCAVIKQNRYNPAMRFLRNMVDEGRIGRLVTAGIRVHWCRHQDYYDDPWHGRWSMDGGVLAQQAIHHLDALQWLGGPIEAVCAAGSAILNRLEAEDTAVGLVRFRSGALGTIEATTSARDDDFEASLHLVGEQAMAKIGGRALNKLEFWRPVEPRQGDERAVETFSQDVPTSYGLGHGPLLGEVLDALEKGTPPPIGVDQAMGSLRLVHALYASMETGGWVALEDNPTSTRLGIVNSGAS
ncbi:MAG: Gfo/Idh/MocA family oxidoreductase [Thalassobaculum sp.]|uniref:Gfo/Idh/MocA family protein n=1 Tax=Thalassobaculum sp. TaxID=2022740 RepID=UPI0032EBB780